MLRHSRYIVLGLLFLALTSLACSLGTSENDSSPSSQKKPLVLIVAPVNKLYDADIPVYAEGVPVEFRAIAQDLEIGVARIEFRVDDLPVGEVKSDQPGGQPSLDAGVVWVATGATGHLITVEGFRADGSSLGLDDRSIRVAAQPGTELPAGNTTALETPNSATESTQPTLPAQQGPLPTAAFTPTVLASGSPTAVVSTPSLNVRQGPGTSYPSVGALVQGDRVTVVGRNADSSWWAVTYGGGTAWVFAGLVTIEGDVSQVPLVAAP
jgi:hypothetical protein